MWKRYIPIVGMIKFRDITILISHVEMHNDLTSESEILRVEMHGYIVYNLIKNGKVIE